MSRKERGSSAPPAMGRKDLQEHVDKRCPAAQNAQDGRFVKIETTREMTFMPSNVIAQVAVSF
jgi:hypothetical protein